MKITDFAILFVIIFFPLFWLSGLHTDEQSQASSLQISYTTALRTASQDAGQVMSTNEQQQYEAGYSSEKFFRADKELALQTFLNTLYLNFGIRGNESAQQNLLHYIPAIVVIDYDGYYIYATENYIGADGSSNARHTWHPKKPYAYSDAQGNSIQFTLDHTVHVTEANTGKVLDGQAEQLANETDIALLDQMDTFEQVRRTAIVSSIQKDLAYYINKHNEYASHYGISYTFTLPTISQEEWNNSINDIGILSFLQGIPTGSGYYNNYALGGGRLVKKTSWLGTVDPDSGIKYAYPNGCKLPAPAQDLFTDAKEAAKSGYFIHDCRNPLIH
ncbi:hypothetical protein PO903_18115 [Paenibacillus sp. PK4536]|uniref:hypothetical protein n=1 Tax=Paenibacillus sp. PK4536 TaxID=3024576 RepID=UPI002359811E|nr:hypothetical protein [Paenibacillus sp. PK4536]WIM38544.1 hypothetical protein PO903_18115 [Paenibacillus sp. PK4536]